MLESHVAVIGGGISGLSTAFFLSRNSSKEKKLLRVTVFEATGRWGGVLRTLHGSGAPFEAGADAFDGRGALDLCRELGLQDEIEPRESTLDRISISRKRKLLTFNLSSMDPWTLLRNPAVSLKARARLLFEVWIPSPKGDLDEDLESFARRRFGQAFLSEVIEPLAQGVLMARAKDLSLKEYFPQWQKMEFESGSFTRGLFKEKRKLGPGASFFTLRGGLEDLTEALVKKLPREDLKLGTRALSLKWDKRWKILLMDGRTMEADAVCVALPAPEAARLLKDFAPELSVELAEIRYDPVIAVNMVFPSGELSRIFPLSGFVVPSPEKKWPFASLKVIGKTEDGKGIKLRAFISGVLQPEMFGLEEALLKERVLGCLSGEWGIKNAPSWISVERYPEALVQYGTGHAQRMARIERMLKELPGLFLIGNGYHGFGISDCIRGARAAAEKIRPPDWQPKKE